MRNKDCLKTASKQPLISIITVTLNAADTLEMAIKSVVDQKFNDFEYIVVDGGSVDGTIEIIKHYESYLACWISEKDQGVYDAMNKGVSLSNGKWFYFLGADDLLLDGFALAADHLKDEKTLYYGNVYRPGADRIYDGNFSAYKLACRNICHQSIFYPRRVWDKYSYNLTYPVLADYELNLRCFADAEIQLQHIPLVIAVFSDEGGLSGKQKDFAFEKDRMSLVYNFFPRWIYILVFIRTFVLKILDRLRVQKTCVRFYHYLLRMRQKFDKNIIG